MINEDAAALTNLDVETPSPLSSPTDRSSNGSSSGGSSPSTLRKRLQSLPSGNGVPDVGPRPSRGRYANFSLRETTNSIEERDESEENDVQLPSRRKSSRSRDFRARDPRERRRARIRLEASRVEEKTMVLSRPSNTENSISQNESRTEEMCPGSLVDEGETSRRSFDSPCSTTETERNSSTRCSSPYFRKNSADDVRPSGTQRNIYTRHTYSPLPPENPRKDRVELSPIGSSCTRPRKFGGYRPPAGIVLKNLSSGSDSETNSPIESNVALPSQRADRPIVFPTSTVSFSGSNHAIPVPSDRNNVRIPIDRAIVTPSSSARRSSSCRNSDRQLSDISEYERVETNVTFPNSKMECQETGNTLSSSAMLGQINSTYRIFDFSKNDENVNRLPMLSTRSNVCEYNKRRYFATPYTSRTSASLELSACQLKNAVSLRKSSRDTLDKLTAQGNEASSDQEDETSVGHILPDPNNLSGHSSCRKSVEKDEYNGSKEQKYFPEEDPNLHISGRLLESRTSENFHERGVESMRRNNGVASSPDRNYVEETRTNRESSKESFRCNSQRSDNTCDVNDAVRVPALLLNSQDMSWSASPVSVQDAKQQVLDANVLIKALSNASFNESTRGLDGNSGHSHGDGCDKGNSSSRLTFTKRESTMENCRDRSSFKLSSRIPVKIPDRKIRVSLNRDKSVSPLEEKLSFDRPKNLTAKVIFVNSNEQVSPNLTPLSKESLFSPKRKYNFSHLQESDDSRMSRRTRLKESLSETIGSKLISASCLHFENQSTTNVTQNCDDSKTSAEREYLSIRDIQSDNHSSLEQLGVINNVDHLVRKEDEDINKANRKTLFENSLSGDFVASVPSVNHKSSDFSHFQSNDPPVAHLSGVPLVHREYHSEINNFYFGKEVPSPSVSSSDIVSAKNMSDFESAKSKCSADEKFKSDHDVLQEMKTVSRDAFSIKASEADQGVVIHENSNTSLKKENESTISAKDTEFVREIGDMKRRDGLGAEEEKPFQKSEKITSAKRLDEGKHRFSIERLAVEQFRKNILSERAKAVQSESTAFSLEKPPEALPLPIRFSSSASKLHRTSDGTRDSPRFGKKSQDRFPFTISEKTRNPERNSPSSESAYKLSVHPSITRLAGSGVEDTPVEITKCLVYEEEKTSRGLAGMRGLVRRFSARLRRSGKERKKAKRSNERANVIYENCAYREESVGNTCSESSVADKFVVSLSKTKSAFPIPLEEKSPILSCIRVSNNEDTEDVPLSPQHPRRRYDRDNAWVQAFKDVKSNQQEEISKQKHPNSPTASSNDPYSTFLVKNTTHLSNISAVSEKVACATSKRSRSNPLRRKGNRVRVSDSLPVILKSSTEYVGERGSGDRYVGKDENAKDTEKDIESDCLCSRFCGMISTRFLSAYQSTINRRDSRPVVRRGERKDGALPAMSCRYTPT